MGDILDEFLNEPASLETKLKVSNDMAFISLLTELGYRPDKMWGPDEEETYKKLMKASQKHTDYQLGLIKESEPAEKPKKVVAAYKLLDLINELNQVFDESLVIKPNGLQVDFILHRGDKSTQGTMPPNHHCDLERIIDLVKFLKQRLDKDGED